MCTVFQAIASVHKYTEERLEIYLDSKNQCYLLVSQIFPGDCRHPQNHGAQNNRKIPSMEIELYSIVWYFVRCNHPVSVFLNYEKISSFLPNGNSCLFYFLGKNVGNQFK